MEENEIMPCRLSATQVEPKYMAWVEEVSHSFCSGIVVEEGEEVEGGVAGVSCRVRCRPPGDGLSQISTCRSWSSHVKAQWK